MSAHTVRFYVDYGSPYSYIASHRIEKMCQQAGAELQWMPVVLGGIFQGSEIQPPHTNFNRCKYLFEDLRDLSVFYGIPYKERTVFLFKPVLALRATLAVPQGPERARAVHALFQGAFVDDLDLAQPAVVMDLLNGSGFDGAALLARAQEPQIKDELRAITDEAIAKSVFGAPTFIVHDRKMFWGQDRLPLLQHYLLSA